MADDVDDCCCFHYLTSFINFIKQFVVETETSEEVDHTPNVWRD